MKKYFLALPIIASCNGLGNVNHMDEVNSPEPDNAVENKVHKKTSIKIEDDLSDKQAAEKLIDLFFTTYDKDIKEAYTDPYGKQDIDFYALFFLALYDGSYQLDCSRRSPFTGDELLGLLYSKEAISYITKKYGDSEEYDWFHSAKNYYEDNEDFYLRLAKTHLYIWAVIGKHLSLTNKLEEEAEKEEEKNEEEKKGIYKSRRCNEYFTRAQVCVVLEMVEKGDSISFDKTWNTPDPLKINSWGRRSVHTSFYLAMSHNAPALKAVDAKTSSSNIHNNSIGCTEYYDDKYLVNMLNIAALTQRTDIDDVEQKKRKQETLRCILENRQKPISLRFRPDRQGLIEDALNLLLLPDNKFFEQLFPPLPGFVKILKKEEALDDLMEVFQSVSNDRSNKNLRYIDIYIICVINYLIFDYKNHSNAIAFTEKYFELFKSALDKNLDKAPSGYLSSAHKEDNLDVYCKFLHHNQGSSFLNDLNNLLKQKNLYLFRLLYKLIKPEWIEIDKNAATIGSLISLTKENGLEDISNDLSTLFPISSIVPQEAAAL